MLQPVVSVVIYFVLFVASIIGLLWWRKRQRKRKLPFGDEMLLLRGPGETQLKLVREFEENMFGKMMWAAFAPVIAAGVCLSGTSRLPQQFRWLGVVIAATVLIGSFAVCVRWFSNRLVENAARYLGYFWGAETGSGCGC